MAVKRSDFVQKNPEKTAEERWQQEVSYQMSRALENTRKICELARTRKPLWNEDQVKELTETLEAEAQQIREAYKIPAAVGFRFGKEQ